MTQHLLKREKTFFSFTQHTVQPTLVYQSWSCIGYQNANTDSKEKYFLKNVLLKKLAKYINIYQIPFWIIVPWFRWSVCPLPLPPAPPRTTNPLGPARPGQGNCRQSPCRSSHRRRSKASPHSAHTWLLLILGRFQKNPAGKKYIKKNLP